MLLTLTDDRVINLGVAVGANGKDGEKGDKGDTGATGAQGEKGDTGAAGKDGVGISRAYINQDGQLILDLSDGSSFNLDKVVGNKGDDGVGVSNSVINEDGELAVSYTHLDVYKRQTSI